MAARRITGSLLATGLIVALVGSAPPAPADDTSGATDTALHLVTLERPGTAGYDGRLSVRAYRTTLTKLQDSLLARLE